MTAWGLSKVLVLHQRDVMENQKGREEPRTRERHHLDAEGSLAIGYRVLALSSSVSSALTCTTSSSTSTTCGSVSPPAPNCESSADGRHLGTDFRGSGKEARRRHCRVAVVLRW